MTKIFKSILLVSDIDGTFVNDKGESIKENIDAVEYFKANGGIFTFATGRYEQDRLVQNFKHYPNAPGVYTNGSNVYDFSDEKMIYKQCLDSRDIIDTLYDIREKYIDISISYTTDDGIELLDKRNEYIKSYNWYKIVMVGDSDVLDEIREYINSIYGDIYAYNKSVSTLFEILDKDATKGTMVKNLHEYLNDKYNAKLKLYAIGDYENDISMLNYADISACPSNAIEMVKKVCDITVCSNNEGAVADLIYKIEKEIENG